MCAKYRKTAFDDDMTIEIDEKALGDMLDGIKAMSEDRRSSSNPYARTYSDYIKAYSDIGLYVTVVRGHHVVMKSSEM